MKRILSTLTLLLCFAFTAVNAQVITAERAAEIANSFFSAGVQKSAAARGVVSSPSLTSSFDSNDVTETASAEPTFYVLTNPEGGFVIVSGEETQNPIIGYSLDGTIDVNNLPDGFVGYMTDIDAQVKALREYNTNNPQKAAAARSVMQRAASYEYNANTMGNIVKNLNTAPWGQRTPFNKLCPVVGTGNAVTGCVPTAYSILCRYYEWPEQGVGTVYNPSTGAPLQLGHTYDYASMRNDNYPSGYTDTEATAVATLMRDMGYAYTASYGSGTTTTSNENPSNLITYFGFKCETPLNHGNGCTKYDLVNNMEQWVTYIKNCLNAGYPIPYSSTTALDAQDRHIYILDGYTDNNYFHFNWGWSGQGNGWFTLDNMVPDDYSNYSKSHRAYFNVIPDKTTYTVTATVNDSNMGTVSINGGTAGSSATANLFSGATATLTAHPAQGFALASWTKNGVVVGSRTTIEVTVGTDANDYVANFDDEANVYVIKDYIISPSTVGLTGSSKESVVNYQTSDEYPAALRLASTATNGTSLFAMSRISDDQIRLYAYDQTTSSTTVKYTLSVPDGYQITEYKFEYSLNNISYPCSISYSGGTISSPTDEEWHSSPVIVNNAQTAEFTISAEKANSSSNFYIKNFTVTVAKISSEGGTGGSTPTPTTYTINATAGAGGSVTINGDAVSQKSVNENSTVTLVATPQTGYRFVNWTSGASSVVSTDATYSFTATGNTNLVANFEKTGYTVSVAAGEGGVAYIGTKGTTQATANYNGNVTITAEANDGYRFVEWRAYDSHFSSNAQQDVTVTTDVTYTAVFEAEANEPVEVSGDLEFTFTRDGENATVTVLGADGVTATIAATSPDATNTTTTTGNWNTGGEMANHTDVLCTSTNTSRATEGSPITYTLTVNGLRATVTDVVFTHVAVNSGGNLQPSDGTIRHCNFKLEANGNAVGTLIDQNIWIPSGSTDKTIEFNDLSVAADGTLTIKLTIYKGTSNDGCYYGLKKITLTAAEPEQPTDPLAGKYFRLKTTVNSAVKYMNVGTRSDNSHGNVNMVDLNESSDDQIFLFEQSGDGYKLKANSGNYIKCAEWNVNANTTNANEASVLLFEESGDGYLINWYNTFKGAIKYFNIQTANAGDRALHPYSDGDKNSAAVWVLEEVIPSNEKTLTVTYSGAAWNNEASGWWVSVVTNTTPAVTVKTTDGTPKIGFSTFDGVRHPYLLDGNSFTISVPANCKITGYRLGYQAHNLVSKSVTYTNGKESTGAVTIAQSDEQNTLTVTGLDNSEIAISVADQTTQAGFIIKSLEITYIENEFTPLPFKAEIENWRNDNPNTHLGTITIGGTAMKLTPAHQTASELTMPLAEGTTLAFTRKYRGFEFQGFYIGATELGTNPTLTADNVAAIDENNPLIAKFTATDDVTLFYDDDEFSYRIPAIVKTVKDDKHKLIAISDYRHSFDDIGRDNHKTGTTQVDLVIRTSEDNGATWTAKQTIAEGSQHFGYGDAAAVANGQDVLVMAVAGNVFYAYADSDNPQQAYRIYSNDNGVTWEKEDISSNMESLFPDYHGLFFGSGKLAVDPDFNDSGNARVYGAILMKDSQGERNYVLYSDDWGATWNILGGVSPASANEPKIEILPNGQILLSARRNGGRTFNVFTYTDKANNAGTWSTVTNGCDNGGNSTNGEIICLDAKRPNGKPTKILLQSQPYGSDRRNVSIWYKEISANETYTASSIASDWTMGKQVSTQLSAYSAMALQENGEIALFFEEAPCYGDDYTKGYSMVYVPLTIEEITGENFLNPNAVVETVTVDVTLTDEQGNTYTHQFDYLPGDAAAINAALMTAYPFITELGEGNLQGSDSYYTYTNTVTLPFKVSNANTTVWHNIYWPANDTSAGKYYPIYLLSTAEGDTYVAKKTETKHYGESSYNTLNWADELSWAVYSVDGTLNFKFKNKLTGKFMAVNGVVSTGSANNVIYTDEANATTFTLEKYTGTNTYYGNYAIKSVYNGTTGYVCNTSVGHANATNYTGTGHAGAWVKFVEAPDYQAIIEALTASIAQFGAGDGNYIANDQVSGINIENIATMPLNTINTHTETVQTVKESYREVVLTVNETETETATVPGSVSITVNGSEAETVNNKFVPANATVSILATANPGFRFKNWTRPAAQASAAARAAEARNSDVVSSDNPYTVTVSEALSLEANFEEIVVDVTLTDAQSNTYNVQVSGFTAEITKEAVAEKLRAAYPYITLGTTDANGNVIDNGVLNIDGTAYTYTNRVELPFKVSSVSDYWHNIYYPSNNKKHSGYPNYIAAFNDEDDIVDMAESPDYAYGENPTYNTTAGNPMISWAIYNVNNSFEFIFKNQLTNKYIKVESVVNATGDTQQNVKFVENAGDATAFTLLEDADSYNGDYALVAKVGDATGYLCATFSDEDYVTHFDRTNHQGAWVKFVEVDYGQYIGVLDTKLKKFDVGDDKHMITDEIQPMINALLDEYGVNITKSQFEAYFDAIDAMDAENWPKLSLTIAPDNSGTTTIAGEEGVTRKYVPTGDLIINATPAEGYHFVSWTSGTNEVSTAANYTFNITAATTLTANFAKNSYTINVATNGTGGSAMIGTETSATVEHGGSVTLTADANDGYEFVNWTKGTDVVSTDANYTVTNVTANAEYVANFQLAGTPVTYYTVEIVTEGISNDKFAAYINTGTTQNETQKSYQEGSTVSLIAVPDNATVGSTGYAFDGWYLDDTRISTSEEIEFVITGDVTYKAKFVEGIRVSVRAERGWPHIYLLDSNKEVGGTSSSTLIAPGRGLKLSVDAEFGCRFVRWTVNGVEQSTENPFIVENLTESVTYMAICEPAYYTLTVSSDPATAGTVSATSGAATGTSIMVGHNMAATITASPVSGYTFVNWTKGNDVVSTDATYEVPAIDDVNAMVNTEYVANFVEATEPTQPVGTYYRIGYDGFAAAAAAPAARAAATRAIGDVQTYIISPTTGTPNDKGKFYNYWEYTKNGNFQAGLRMESRSNGNLVEKINTLSGGTQHSLVDGSDQGVTFTVSVPQDGIYKITGYNIEGKAYGNITLNGTSVANGKTGSLSASGLDVYNFSFTIVGSYSGSYSYGLDITTFTVTIQQVGEDTGGEGGGETPETPDTPETPSNRYYIQSKASGLSGKANALLMTQETGASSIFYYADSKLMSYDKGTYIKEDGGTRGLQAVGTSGNVTITTVDGISKIQAPSYMHANKTDDGTTYFIDHCGSNNGDAEHNFIIEEVTELPVTISSVGYASWYAPVAVELPDGVTAWYLTTDGVNDDYVTMTEITGNIVPANTGVILEGDAGTHNLTITTTDYEIGNNLLTGTVEAKYIDYDAYVLSKPSGKEIGFYLADRNIDATGNKITDEALKNQEGTRFKNNSHKAYLRRTAVSPAMQMSAGFRFRFSGGVTTPIDEMEYENSEVKGIYDLTGRKLEGISGTGIYIINGKKVLIK